MDKLHDIMFVYHWFLACAQIIMTDSSLAKLEQCSIHLFSKLRDFLTDSSTVVSSLALIGGNEVKMEASLVKLQI